jgi:hypothetical protein
LRGGGRFLGCARDRLGYTVHVTHGAIELGNALGLLLRGEFVLRLDDFVDVAPMLRVRSHHFIGEQVMDHVGISSAKCGTVAIVDEREERFGVQLGVRDQRLLLPRGGEGGLPVPHRRPVCLRKWCVSSWSEVLTAAEKPVPVWHASFRPSAIAGRRFGSARW